MNSQRRIIYIHGGGDTIGGIETYIVNCLFHHKIYKPYLGIIKKGKFSDYALESGFKNIVLLNGGRIRELYKSIRAIINAVIFIKKNKIELVIAHGTHSWIFGWIIALFSNSKSIFYLQGQIEKNSYRNLLTGIGLRLIPTIYVTNSEFTANSLRKHSLNKIYVNYLSSDIETFDNIDALDARKILLDEFNIPYNNIIFTIVGRIQEWKGQDTVIKSFGKLRNDKNVKLLIVGDYSFEKDKIYYNNLISLANNNKNIIFTGFRKDIPIIMKGSDVIIHASKEPEPFGIVIVEAMMSKKPVIATSHGGPLEIINNKKTGLLFNPEDSETLTECMDNLIVNEKQRSKLAESAYKVSKKKFTMSVSVSNLENIIDTIIE